MEEIKMNKRSLIIKAMGSIVSIGYIAYSFVGDFVDLPNFGEVSPIMGMFIGFIVFAALVVWHFVDMSREISYLKSKRPRIIFGEPKCIKVSRNINDYGANSFIAKQMSPKTDFYLFCVDFINSPIEKDNNDALGVQAFLEFYDESNSRCYTYFGRWIDMPERTLNEKHRYADIPSDSRTTKRLGIMYVSGERGNNAYLLDSDIVDNAPEGMVLNPPFLLAGKYSLVISISGRNFPEISKVYEIQNSKDAMLIFSEKKNSDKWLKKIADDKKKIAKLWSSIT